MSTIAHVYRKNSKACLIVVCMIINHLGGGGEVRAPCGGAPQKLQPILLRANRCAMSSRFTYIRSKDKRSNGKRSNDQRPKDKRSNDKRSKDKRPNWTQGRIGTQDRMTEGRMTEGRKGLKVERPNTEFESRKTEGRKSFLQFLKLY